MRQFVEFDWSWLWCLSTLDLGRTGLADEAGRFAIHLDRTRTAVAYFNLLLDLQMPRKDGLATLREIRKMSKELPVVVLSGTSSPLSAAQAIKFGANDFLPKPVREAALHEAITNSLGRSHKIPKSARSA